MGERKIEITSATAVWHHSGLPGVPIRWVLIRDPENRFEPQSMLCTDPARDPTQIVTWYVRRWQVEVQRDNQDGDRIASPEMLPAVGSLPHLICSRRRFGGGGGDEAGEHDDAR